MVPTRYERHHNASARGTKERGIYKQIAHLILIRIPRLYGRRSGIERAHTEQHVRNHRSQPDSDSSSRLFSLLQTPILHSIPLSLVPSLSQLPRTSTHFNVPANELGVTTWCRRKIVYRKIYGLKNRDKNRERRIKEEREGGRKRAKKRKEKLKGRKKKKKERNNPTRDDNAITHAIYPESTRIHTDYLTLATVAVAVMGRNQAPPFNIPSGTRFANR